MAEGARGKAAVVGNFYGAIDDPDVQAWHVGDAFKNVVYLDAASVVGKPFRYGAFEFTSKSATETDLSSEIRALRAEVRGLADAIRRLGERMGNAAVVLRNVSLEDAKREVAAYLQAEERAFPSDIAGALTLDYELVTAALEELRRDGRIDREDDSEG